MKTSRFFTVLLLTGAVCGGAQGAGAIMNSCDNSGLAQPGSPASAHPTGARAQTKAIVVQAPVIAIANDLGVNTALPYLDLLQANYSFAGQGDSSQVITNNTRLAAKSEAASSITEPASEVLMLVALAALAIAVRRQLPG